LKVATEPNADAFLRSVVGLVLCRKYSTQIVYVAVIVRVVASSDKDDVSRNVKSHPLYINFRVEEKKRSWFLPRESAVPCYRDDGRLEKKC
jgi:hypothetical protein